MQTLNLGILAHVDAGKTSLTERLLYAAGVIDEPGSVDDGNTQTDSLALERRRGITIKSAVVSFAIDDVTVNLIDTPGHPDFIAEVERALAVLDGAVLVVSAVEGVQAQTRVLMRTLQRLRIPTLLFVNKIDRAGAQDERTLRAVAEKLSPAIVAMGSVDALGTRAARFAPHAAADRAFTARLAEVLADHDEALLAAYVDDEASVAYERPAPRARRADPAGADASRVLRLGHHGRRRRRRSLPASPSCCRPPRATSTDRCRAPCSRSSAGRPARRSPTCGCSPARCARASGCVSPATTRTKVTAISVFDRGAGRRARVGRRGADRAGCAGWTSVSIGDAIGRPPPRPTGPAALRAADARDRRRARPRGRPGRHSTSRSLSSPSRTR